MKIIFSLFLLTFVNSLSELAEMKKKSLYLKRIIQIGMGNSPVILSEDNDGKIFFKLLKPINPLQGFAIKSNYLFTNLSFYPFRELISKIINDYLRKENSNAFDQFSLIFSYVYQLLYFKDGNKKLAKSYYEKNISNYDYIPIQVLIFDENEDLEEFIDNIPIVNKKLTAFTDDKSFVKLFKRLKLTKLEKFYRSAKDIYKQILKYANENKDKIVKAILLSFVSNLNDFMRITSYLFQNSFIQEQNDLLNVFPKSLQEPFKIYNNYVKEFSGASNNQFNIVISPIFELFTYNQKTSSTDISELKMKVVNQVGMFFFTKEFNEGDSIKLTYDNLDNQMLIIKHGDMVENNAFNHDIIYLNFSRFNFTEKEIDICEQFGCGNIDFRKLIKNKESIEMFNNFPTFINQNINLNLLNLIKLSQVDKSKLNDYSYFNFKNFVDFDYVTEFKTFLVYYQLLINKDQELNYQYLVEDYNFLQGLYIRSKMDKKFLIQIFPLKMKLTFYLLALEQKRIVTRNRINTLDYFENKLRNNLIKLKKGYIF